MSEYSSLKATINANVKTNNNQEITGSVMNSVLNAMVNSLGAGYQFMGVATPTNPGSAQTPDYKCLYLATTPGTYTNLGGLVVADGEVAILKYDSAWTKEVPGIASADKLNQLGQYIPDIFDKNQILKEYLYKGNISMVDGAILSADGSISNMSGYKATIFIPVKTDEIIYYTLSSVRDDVSLITLYDSNKNFVSSLLTGGVEYQGGSITIPSDGFVRICSGHMSSQRVYFCFNNTVSIKDIIDNKSNYASEGKQLLKGIFVRCGISYSDKSGNGRCITSSPISYAENIVLKASEGYRFYIIYCDQNGGNPTIIGWETNLLIPANQYFLCMIDDTQSRGYIEPVDFIKGVYIESHFLENSINAPYRSLYELKAKTTYGYYQNSGSLNRNIQKGRFLSFIRAYAGTKVKAVDTVEHPITGMELIQYDENWNFVSRLGNLSSKAYLQNTSTVSGFLGIYVNFEETDISEILDVLSQNILISFSNIIGESAIRTIDDAMERNPSVFVNKTVDSYGNITTASNSRAVNTEYIKVGAGTKIISNDINYIYNVFMYDLWSKSYIGKSEELFGLIYTIPFDCYVRIWCRDKMDYDLSEKLEELRDVFKFIIQPVTIKDSDALPSYYFADNYIGNKVETIRNHYNDCGYNGDIFAFITDVHWNTNAKKSPLLLQYLIKKTALKRIVFGGDAITDNETINGAFEDLAEFRYMFRFAKNSDWLPILGNHEFNDPGASTPSLRLSASQAYCSIIKEQENILKCLDEYLSYWDNEKQKIRYYLLGSMFSSQIAESTKKLFLDSLLAVPNGYSVLVCSHVGLTSTGTIDSEIEPIVGGLDACRNKTTYIYDGVEYNFSARDTEIIGLISGHIHLDNIVTTESGTVIVAVTTDGSYELGGLTRTNGTISENAFDIVQIDKSTKTVYLTRIGAGSDRMFTY